jgi:hypothetical protein
MTNPLLRGRPLTEPPETRAEAVGAWTAAGELPFAAFWAAPSAVPLANGKVLIAGGEDGERQALAGVALYDPAANAWTATGSLRQSRRLHSTTLLADGKVLVAGGISGGPAFPPAGVTSAEIFDPASGTWQPTGNMLEARFAHSATLLPNGKVLVAGGNTVRSAQSNRAMNTVELYDPATGVWSPVEPMTDARFGHGAVRLASGKVLVSGGIVTAGRGLYAPMALCELYDPATGKWMPTGNLAVMRKSHQTTLLADGKVLVTGGDGRGLVEWVYEPYSQSTTEIYDPAAGTWSRAGDMGFGRSHHRDVRLASGKVLMVGGTDDGTFDVGYRNAELFDPATKTWTPTGAPEVGRYAFVATSLADGRVLIAGGITRSGLASPYPGVDVVTATAEIFTP